MPKPASLLLRLRRAALDLGLPGQKVLVACSGGKDSVALLLGLCELRQSLSFEVEAATIDHRLRPESGRDALYVERIARALGIGCTVRAVEVGREGGVEAAARRARYRALREIARERGCSLIATGHTLDDQAETVLMRLGRGAGTRGLRGILARRGAIVRPLLEVSRAEVGEYLHGRRVHGREDPTNRSLQFTRNRVRARVLPAMREALGDKSIASVARFAAAAADDERLLSRLARRQAARLLELRPDGFAGDVAALLALDPALQTRVLRLGARRVGLRLDLRHALALRAALGSPGPRRVGPRRVGLTGGARFEVRYGRFELRLAPAEAAEPVDQPLATPGVTAVGGALVTVRELSGPGPAAPGCVRIAADGITPPLRLRTRRPGDRFRPRGGREKKLKSWLIDQKVPPERRDALWLLADSAGRVLWLVGLRASQHAAAGEQAARAWEVEVRDSGSTDASRPLSSGEPPAAGAAREAESAADTVAPTKCPGAKIS